MYSTFMSISSFVLAYYLLSVGMGWHTPKTKVPLTDLQLNKLRRVAKIAAPALLTLGILYGYAALYGPDNLVTTPN